MAGAGTWCAISSSMGGTKKENVVICLESPRIREAVAEYIRINIPKFHAESRTALRHHGIRADVHLLLRPQPAACFTSGWQRNTARSSAPTQMWGTSYQRLRRSGAAAREEFAPAAGDESRRFGTTGRASTRTVSPIICCGCAARSASSMPPFRSRPAAVRVCWPAVRARPESTKNESSTKWMT